MLLVECEMRVSQYCCWRFKASGMWCRVIERVVYRNAFECRAPLTRWQCVTSQQNWIFAAGITQDTESL